MPKFTIIETAKYEVEADTAQEALDKYLQGSMADFPCDVTERDVVDENGEAQEVQDQ